MTSKKGLFAPQCRDQQRFGLYVHFQFVGGGVLVPFNDAYRYMDWLLTVLLLLLETPLVMDLTPQQHNSKAWLLGLSAALRIVTGCYGELVVTGDLTPRWVCN